MATRLPEPQLQRLRGVMSDPVAFSRRMLRHDPYDIGASILRSVSANRRTAVKACHASGKTFTAAEAALWWVTRYADGVVVTTAPTFNQVRRLLWGEIHKSIGAARIRYPDANQTELYLGPNRYMVGLSTNEGVNFQGFHGHILIIIDEAVGVAGDIWEAIEGIRAGGDVHVLALGNPTVPSGPFYEAFTTQRAGWATYTISAFDTPNFAGLSLNDLLELPDAALDENRRPYLVTRRWVREKYSDWGTDHAMWAARVLGQFPDQSEDSLISLAWLEAARSRAAADDGLSPEVAGIDVAGPGEDETTLYLRQGVHLLQEKAWAKPDPRGEAVAALEPWRRRLSVVNVDSAGIGYYFGKHLADQGFKVRFVNVGTAPHNPAKYVNLKAELYWGLRMRFQEGHVNGLTTDAALGQLAGIRYDHDARGRVAIESKEQARKRGVRSPDKAEGIMLAYAYDEGLPPVQLGASLPKPVMSDVRDMQF